jgi:hypothetical protein
MRRFGPVLIDDAPDEIADLEHFHPARNRGVFRNGADV